MSEKEIFKLNLKEAILKHDCLIRIVNKNKLNQLKEKLANDKKYLVLIQGMRNSLDTLETKMKFREMIRETNIEIEKTQNDIYKFMGFNFK